jgi:hypothetical protein
MPIQHTPADELMYSECSHPYYYGGRIIQRATQPANGENFGARHDRDVCYSTVAAGATVAKVGRIQPRFGLSKKFDVLVRRG